MKPDAVVRAHDLPSTLDLTDVDHEACVVAATDKLAVESDPAELASAESAWCSSCEPVPLGAHLALKLARSRQLMTALPKPTHLSVVFAVYKETTRMKRRSEHPHGEDFLRRKVRQLDWLVHGTAHTWDLTVVDDGCPDDSGADAAVIIAAEHWGGRVRMRRLADAIAENHPAVRPLADTDESRKGGSVLLGMTEAVAQERPGHVVLFTDADLSTHLGQSGLLIDALVNGGADAAIGSRREPTSVVVKQGARNDRGKLFIYLWKRLFPELRELVDTQCGFKAFTAETVRRVAAEMIEKQFAFDIELLLKTQLRHPGSITRVPIAWIDSEAASTTTDLQPYLPMLRKMATMARTYLPARPESERFASFIDSLDDAAWDRLVDAIPIAITEREPHTFGDWAGVDVDALKSAAGL